MPVPLLASIILLVALAGALALIAYMVRAIKRLQKQNLQLRKRVVKLRQDRQKVLSGEKIKIHRHHWEHYEQLTRTEFVESHSGSKDGVILN